MMTLHELVSLHWLAGFTMQEFYARYQSLTVRQLVASAKLYHELADQQARFTLARP